MPTKVLLIEDGAGDARLLQEMLAEAAGAFNLSWEESLHKGLACLAVSEIDVVLLDLGLPDSQGLETLEAVKKAAPVVPVIVTTGEQDVDLSTRAIERGAQDFLVKGRIESDLLYRSIRYAIERKHIEEELRRSKMDLNRAQAVAHTGSWRLDVHGGELLWSDETYRIFGVDPGEQMTYEKFLDLIPPTDRHLVDGEWTAAMNGKPYDVEHRVLVDGGVRWVRETAELDMDEQGNLQAGFGVVQDITQRKRMEAAISDASERYSMLFFNTSDGILIHNLEGIVQEVNEAYCRMSGYKLSEIQGHSFHKLEAAAPSESFSRIKSLMERGGHDNYEARHRRRDGSVFDVDITALFLNRRGGEIAIFARDITERKRAEKLARQLNHDLIRQSNRLEAANRELEAFTYSVSHDLRAPLRAIYGFSEILKEDFGKRLDDDGRHDIDVICSNTIKMDQLINDLLSLSRCGRQTMNREEIDMERLVAEVYDELHNLSPERRIHFSLETMPAADGDATLIRQVWSNYLANAIKFTGRRDPAEIAVGGATENGQNVYFVKDNGVGFDMKHAGRLFEAFQRLHSEDEFEGTGVGLAIVSRIIKRHGGDAWGEAEPGKGATFYFSLPINQRSEPEG